VTVLSDAAGGRLGLADNAVFLFGSLAGDADGSGGVDLDDFVLLKQNFGTAGSGIPSGDFDASGHVDLDDFVTLKQNFAASLGDPFPTAGIAGTADLLAAGAAAPRPVRARRPGRSAGSRRFRDASGALDLLSAITLRPLA